MSKFNLVYHPVNLLYIVLSTSQTYKKSFKGYNTRYYKNDTIQKVYYPVNSELVKHKPLALHVNDAVNLVYIVLSPKKQAKNS